MECSDHFDNYSLSVLDNIIGVLWWIHILRTFQAFEVLNIQDIHDFYLQESSRIDWKSSDLVS